MKGGRTDTHLRVDGVVAPTLRDAAAPHTLSSTPPRPEACWSGGALYSRSSAIFSSHTNSCPSFRCILFPHWKCVCVCELFKGPPNETLSEAQPVPLAAIMTTLSRTIERPQKKIAVCFPVTPWALRQKRRKERSEIKIWHFSGRGTAEVFYFSSVVFLGRPSTPLPFVARVRLEWSRGQGGHLGQLPCWDN